jgi:ribonuclease D
MSEHAVELVTDRAAFARLLASLRREEVIGIDTESASFHRYHDRIYLLQVSSRDRTAVVDPLPIGELAGLGDLLRDPRVEFVFHGADNDLRLLQRECGCRPRRLFDTRLAAQFAGEPGIGLAALLERRFGVVTDKRLQRADWSERPLSPTMIEYAATDTRFLPALRDRLLADLIGLGRAAWVAEECELLARTEPAAPEATETAFRRVRGASALDRRGLAVLRELYRWRDATAARLDRAAFRVLGNAALVALATQQPRSLAALARIQGMPRALPPHRASEILRAIERGLELPESELPLPDRRRPRQRDLAFEARMGQLREARARVAAALRLPPGVACPNATLESIARARPRSLDALAAIDGVRRWQVQEFGGELVAAAQRGE